MVLLELWDNDVLTADDFMGEVPPRLAHPQ